MVQVCEPYLVQETMGDLLPSILQETKLSQLKHQDQSLQQVSRLTE